MSLFNWILGAAAVGVGVHLYRAHEASLTAASPTLPGTDVTTQYSPGTVFPSLLANVKAHLHDQLSFPVISAANPTINTVLNPAAPQPAVHVKVVPIVKPGITVSPINANDAYGDSSYSQPSLPDPNTVNSQLQDPQNGGDILIIEDEFGFYNPNDPFGGDGGIYLSGPDGKVIASIEPEEEEIDPQEGMPTV